jgi:hypothetical protein
MINNILMHCNSKHDVIGLLTTMLDDIITLDKEIYHEMV